jgi:hypothetical protein
MHARQQHTAASAAGLSAPYFKLTTMGSKRQQQLFSSCSRPPLASQLPHDNMQAQHFSHPPFPYLPILPFPRLSVFCRLSANRRHVARNSEYNSFPADEVIES